MLDISESMLVPFNGDICWEYWDGWVGMSSLKLFLDKSSIMMDPALIITLRQIPVSTAVESHKFDYALICLANGITLTIDREIYENRAVIV